MTNLAPIDAYQIWDSDPSCRDVWGHKEYAPRDDVSGDKTGVRCVSYDEGYGCQLRGDPSDIDIMEVNFSGSPPVYHWSESSTSYLITTPLLALISSLEGVVFYTIV